MELPGDKPEVPTVDIQDALVQSDNQPEEEDVGSTIQTVVVLVSVQKPEQLAPVL